MNGLQLISERKIESSNINSPSMCVASDGRLFYSGQRHIFLDSKDKKGWLKVYETTKERKFVSISQYEGTLFFVETVAVSTSSNHAVHCLPNVLNLDGTRKNKSPDVSVLFQFQHEGDDVCLSVEDGVCFIRHGHELVSYNLQTKQQHYLTLESFGSVSHAVVLSSGQLWTSADDSDLVVFYNHWFDCML